MKNTLFAAAALTLLGAGAASAAIKAGTYSIQTAYCDHLTVVVDSSGNAYGNSDVSGCDQSAVAGTTATAGKVDPGGSVIQVGGDLGTTDGWSWSINLKAGTAVLRGSDGTNLLGPVDTTITYKRSKDAKVAPPQHNSRPSAVSALLHR